ncbi:MAG TPA: response regulator receiver domain [Allosphingosinicella sp.]|jgi:hypothetical protein
MTAFDDVSRRAAATFLQTIVVVDNKATYDLATSEVTPADEAAPLIEPDAFHSADASAHPTVAEGSSDDPLDAGAISSAFAKAGLVCSVLKPTAAERLEDEIVQASSRADIVVLDWHMEDSGTLATRVTLRLLELDERAGGRLRLIVIYTGRTQLSPISEELAGAHPRFEKIPNAITLQAGNAKVIFLTKLEEGADEKEGGLAVPPERLPARLIGEFAAFTGGLLPNATLAAIAGLRQHTHRVLARFDKDLDAPFLTHRALLRVPGDAEQFAADLIMAELDAQVPIDRIVRDYLSAEKVKQYLEHRMEGGLEPALMLDRNGGKLDKLDLDRACRLVEDGISSLEPEIPRLASAVGQADTLTKFKDALKKEFHERLYRLADSDIAKSRTHHARFAIRTKLKRDAASVRADDPDTIPKLRLGSLLESESRYWICLTPYCDSTRIPTAGGRFLLAELEQNDKQPEIVLPDGDESRSVFLQKKRANLVTYFFTPDAEGSIRATLHGADAIFESVADLPPGAIMVRFRWLGELKAMHAVRFIQAFAANLARVGLDEFEWHRIRQREGDE